jgi:hypothetical protein
MEQNEQKTNVNADNDNQDNKTDEKREMNNPPKEQKATPSTRDPQGTGRASPPSEPAEKNSARPDSAVTHPTPNAPPAGDRESYGDKAHHSNDGHSKNAPAETPPTPNAADQKHSTPSNDSRGGGHASQGSEPAGKNWTRTPAADAPKTQNSQHGGEGKSGNQSDDSNDGHSTGGPDGKPQKHNSEDHKPKAPESQPSARQ